jgi:predicted DNA-binding transcriptional regulator AlpA
MPEVLSIEDMIARYPSTSRQFWAQMRYRGDGPRYFKVGGRKVFYDVQDVLAWEESNKRTRTDDEPQAA